MTVTRKSEGLEEMLLSISVLSYSVFMNFFEIFVFFLLYQ